MRGEEEIRKIAQRLVGPGRKLRSVGDKSILLLITNVTVAIEPENLCNVLVSPRQRAHRTFQLLFDHLENKPKHTLTEEVREWTYGLPLPHSFKFLD